MKRPRAFAYAPLAAPDELLGSWIHRVAIRHDVGASLFAGHARDVDWDATPSLLKFLSDGSRRAVGAFEAMLLSRRQGARRIDFALSAGGAFVGAHAYCPLCAVDDQRRHGATILRATNASLWAVSCRDHHCYLDSVEHPSVLLPGAWANPAGGIRPAIWAEAPKLARLFQRTALGALRGKVPSPLWRVREPQAFLDVAADCVALLLYRPSNVLMGAHGLSHLLGPEDSVLAKYGSTFLDPGLLYRMSSWIRVRALTGVAMLLTSEKAEGRFGLSVCPKDPAYGKRPGSPRSPWQIAMGDWSEDMAAQACLLTAEWPRSLTEQFRSALLARMKEARRLDHIRSSERWTQLYLFLRMGRI